MDDSAPKKSSARSLLGWTDGYHAICREERNVAAIFYHLLMQDTNLRRFLDLVDCKLPTRAEEMAIYFEYAFLRDLWNARVRDIETARALILDLLAPPNADELRTMSVVERGPTRSARSTRRTARPSWRDGSSASFERRRGGERRVALAPASRLNVSAALASRAGVVGGAVIGDRDLDGRCAGTYTRRRQQGGVVLLNKACRPLLLALALTACEPEVEVESTSEWMLGTFSSTYVRNSTIGLTSVGHYEFRPDGTLRVIALTGCEANSEELIHEYTWRRAGDSHVVVDIPAPESSSVQAWIVTQGEDCSTLQVDEVQDGQLRGGPTLWRGALCMKTLPPCDSVECPSCETVWCAEAPAACED